MKWFSHAELPHLDGMLRLKERRGVTISLGLPMLDEEATIEKVLACAAQCRPLVDEIIAFDSGSTDGSQEICAKWGITVVSDSASSRVLSVPLSRGKGWNLWTSLYHLSGDIITWVDTDIENMHPRFILGVIWPLLADPSVCFVKGFYRRPKNDARVTEIMARPFLNLLFPEAAQIVQPLAGEYGGTRAFLEQATFYSGYSVEVALLLQALVDMGDERVAQVDLGERIHALQEVTALGRMSGSILRTMLGFADKYGRLQLSGELPEAMRVYPSGTGDLPRSAEMACIADVALPAMHMVRGYISARAKCGARIMRATRSQSMATDVAEGAISHG